MGGNFIERYLAVSPRSTTKGKRRFRAYYLSRISIRLSLKHRRVSNHFDTVLTFKLGISCNSLPWVLSKGRWLLLITRQPNAFQEPFGWWRIWESNPWHLPCKGSAHPSWANSPNFVLHNKSYSTVVTLHWLVPHTLICAVHCTSRVQENRTRMGRDNELPLAIVFRAFSRSWLIDGS